MIAPHGSDRTAVGLGMVSVLSALFLFVPGKIQFVWMNGAAAGVALGLGVLAIVAGRLGRRSLIAVAGVAFLLAAVVLMVLLTGSAGFLIGNASTFALWLGLGAGLTALGLSRPRA